VGGHLLSSRGYVNSACLLSDVSPGQIYESTQVCGGGGAEYIAQARAITELNGPVTGGIDPSVQWEVGLNLGASAGRADLVHDDGGTLEVYELKQWTNSTYANTQQQAEAYVSALNTVDPEPRAPAQLGSGLSDSGWVDSFLTPVPGFPTCFVAGSDQPQYQYRLHVSWVTTPGVITVWYRDLPCFDPSTQPVPVPEPSASEPLIQAPVPGGDPTPVPLEQVPAGIWGPAPGNGIPAPDPAGGVLGGGGSGGNPGVISQVGPSGVTDSPGGAGWGVGVTAPGGGEGYVTAGGWGDPHLRTFDGLGYDLQGAGEFQFVQDDALNVDIQARMTPIDDSVSVTSRVAFGLAGRDVEVDPHTATLYLDGQETTLADGYMLDLGDGASIVRNQGALWFAWPGAGVRPAVYISDRSLEVYMPQGNQISGLLGNADGTTADDLVTSDGTQLPRTASSAEIQGTFADSWRVTDDDSLFTYASGESTATFTDRTFPQTTLTIGDLSDSVLADATTQCTDAQVVDGKQFDDCVLDWARTQDQSFLAAAAASVTPATAGSSSQFDSDGLITQDFEGDIAPNFASPRYGSGAGTGTFAGPFASDGRYVFYAGDLPGHTSIALSLDLIALGTWTGDGTSVTNVTLGGATVWSGDVSAGTPSATGTTSTGEPYAIYPISVTVPDSSDQLNVGVTTTFPPGSTRAFGIDNVAAQLSLVSPQNFDVAFPFQASEGVPAAGAGDLETVGSEDDYRFTLSAPVAVQVDPTACSPSLGTINWKIVDDSTASVVATGGCSSELTPELQAATYRLVVTRRGATGTYDVSVEPRSTPQSFDVALPVQASNGFPSEGAGNLETTSAQDNYVFSLASSSGLVLDCSATLGWKLVQVATDVTFAHGVSCNHVVVPNVPAGSYRLEVSQNGSAETYDLAIYALPDPQVFDVTLPTSISNGVPEVGAGDLETTASEDRYVFTTPTAGNVQLDFSNCASSLGGHVVWTLVNTDTGATPASGALCSSRLVSNLAAGSYRLSVSNSGQVGTYQLGISLQPPPQTFNVTPPSSIADGMPAAGAGNLETTSSEDDYVFTTSAKGAVQINVSSCALSLGGGVIWTLVNTATGAQVGSSAVSCSSTTLPDIAAGTYRLAVTHNGASGTYNLGLLAVAPQSFGVSLPASISNGAPSSGAGNLETTASEDDYAFTTAAAGAVQLDFSNCASSLGGHVVWTLVNTDTGATPGSGTLCSSTLVSNVPAGHYRVSVTDTGKTGTYQLGISVQPPAQSFNVTPPVSISNGVPAAGAGNLETTSSEDDYVFTTSATGAVQINVSSCAASLGSGVIWKLVNTASNAQVGSSATSCSSTTLSNVAAGTYRLAVTHNGASGTYSLGLLTVAPQSFDVSLPASISDGAPTSGAGNLETTASEDRYQFTTAAAGAVQLDFSNCSSSLGGHVVWTLVNTDTGATPASGTLCTTRQISSLAAAHYRVSVTDTGQTGTYSLAIY